MELGNYILGEDVGNCINLTELSPLEYNIIPKAYKGQRIFKAPDTIIHGRTWLMVLSALPNGKIHQIAAQFISDNEDLVDKAFSESYAFYEKQFGTPQQVTKSGAHRWEQPFGSLMLGKVGASGLRCVNLIATSNSNRLDCMALARMLLRCVNLVATSRAFTKFSNYSEEEIERFVWLRTLEWEILPTYATRSIAPIALFWLAWWQLGLALVVADLLWCFIRTRFVSLLVSEVCLWVNNVYVSVIANVITAIFFFSCGRVTLGFIAIFWHFISAALGFACPPTKSSLIQDKLSTQIIFSQIKSLQ